MKNISKKCFLDCDVILDFLCMREPFVNDARLIFSIFELNKMLGFTSSLAVANVHYIASKTIGSEHAKAALLELNKIVKTFAVDEWIMNKALISNFKDFEDSIQYFTAFKNGIDYIITRNEKDYKKSEIPVFSPKEFLAAFNK